MHIAELRRELDDLRAEVKELKGQGADKVLVQTVEDINRRLTAIETFLNTEIGFRGGE
ncbi:MAG: hypothetical protein H3C68_01440 [Deltaproteobacteria bacterium]|nr:hypothetical protein [Deltaproteobacteria bacterium]MBZ0219083.1 hypothetical protein [Deltaproteobacteria bacterium]